VLQQLRDPLRITNVGLASRDGFHVGRVQQPDLYHLFEAVERCLPIRRGRLHRRDRHPGLNQPVPHQPQRPGRGLERPGLAMTTPPRPRSPQTHRHRGLANIQTGNPVEHHFHLQHPHPLDSRQKRRSPGRVLLQKETDPRAHGNNPAATQGPRALHLYGLTRTSVSRRHPRQPPTRFSAPSAGKR